MSEKKQFPISIELPSGKHAEFQMFKGRDVMNATERAGTDTSKIPLYLMSSTVKIDGEHLVMEDYLEMDGRDYLALLKEFGESVFT
jgi:hypothetical protein